MSSANSIKAQLASSLGSNGLPYWRSLSSFLSGKQSRTEFEKEVRQWINTPELGTLLFLYDIVQCACIRGVLDESDEVSAFKQYNCIMSYLCL